MLRGYKVVTTLGQERDTYQSAFIIFANFAGLLPQGHGESPFLR